MRRFALAPVIALLLVALIAPTASAQPDRSGLLTGIPVSGTLSDATNFVGTLDITGITRDGTDLLFSGEVFDAAGESVGEFTAVVGSLLPGEGDGPGIGQCDILNLDLGPLFLDVLGLQVDLSEVHLDITAVRGPGNLLGNLLCAVAGLLDGGGPLAALDRLLDRIDRIL